MEFKTFEGFSIGLIAGAIVGGTIALLYAPKSGKETRKLIKDTATEVVDEVVDTVKEETGEVKDKVTKVVDAVKEETSEVMDTVKKVESEVSRKGKAAGKALKS